jgi:amidase
MSNDLHWMSAGQLAAAISAGEVTSCAALEHLVARIERLDGPINAVVQWDLDRARRDAADADAAVARGDALGPLHGVPMTVKDSFQTAGCITTSGAPELADFVPEEDAWPVARLREAGAVIFAKTNLPIYAGDIQSYNEVYGTTNNPHDVERTPGGSSGGSAAALAMGFTPIELGSDIGGSIRVPAHYSGVMGHKPSFGIVPGHGQIPGAPGTLSQADLAVSGPMARSVDDLELGLDVLAGPDRWMTPAWRLDLPQPRTKAVGELRIAAWIDDPYCPVDDDTRAALTNVATWLAAAGASVDVEARPGFTLERATSVFDALLFAALAGGHSRDKIEHMATASPDSVTGRIKLGTSVRHRDWLASHERQLQLRERWAEFFAGDADGSTSGFDAILLPVHPRAAIGHDHSPQWERRVKIGGVDKSYFDLFAWIAPAGAGYLPATVVPIGADRDGLPIGVQIVSAFLHDRTALEVARHITALTGGCPRPALA